MPPSSRGIQDGRSFGWDTFTLSDETTKTLYLDALIQETLSKRVGEGVANLFFKGRPGYEPNEEGEIGYGSIDHQSVWCIPHAWNGVGIDLEFLEDFQKFILRQDVIIL